MDTIGSLSEEEGGKNLGWSDKKLDGIKWTTTSRKTDMSKKYLIKRIYKI